MNRANRTPMTQLRWAIRVGLERGGSNVASERRHNYFVVGEDRRIGRDVGIAISDGGDREVLGETALTSRFRLFLGPVGTKHRSGAGSDKNEH